MIGASISLLDFLDAPIVVGDPDGHVVYLNSAFESSAGIPASDAVGQPLASLFEGGGREAVLRAVAGVCTSGDSVRFRLRLGEVGFAALASPIKSDDASVGVVILLSEELGSDPRLLALHRGIQSHLDEVTRGLGELAETTGGLRAARYRQALDDSARSIDELRKLAEEIQKILDGTP
ncbi:MAG: PAS domain-containing protein [Myxococcota bacterium]